MDSKAKQFQPQLLSVCIAELIAPSLLRCSCFPFRGVEGLTLSGSLSLFLIAKA